MINSVYKTNYTTPSLINNLKITSAPAFCAKPSADTINQPKKKSHKLAWTAGIVAALAVGATAYFPALRMKFTNLFKKQVSEEIINNSIRKTAKEISNLANEKAVFINPKTGEVVHSIDGEGRQVVSKGIKSILLPETTIHGHNHPVQILQMPSNINGKETTLEMRMNDITFSLTDIYNDITHRVSHSFVATKENIYHIKFNKNHNSDKFLDYLVNNGQITLKDKKYKTIIEALGEDSAIINQEDVPESALRAHNTEEKFKEFIKNGVSKYLSNREHLKMEKMANAMGWTYWREPVSKV